MEAPLPRRVDGLDDGLGRLDQSHRDMTPSDLFSSIESSSVHDLYPVQIYEETCHLFRSILPVQSNITVYPGFLQRQHHVPVMYDIHYRM
jgi:hypothetical protein